MNFIRVQFTHRTTGPASWHKCTIHTHIPIYLGPPRAGLGLRQSCIVYSEKKIYLKLFLIIKAMLPFPQIPDLQYIKYVLLTKSNLSKSKSMNSIYKICFVLIKGQLMSKDPFGVFKSPKKPKKFFARFLRRDQIKSSN